MTVETPTLVTPLGPAGETRLVAGDLVTGTYRKDGTSSYQWGDDGQTVATVTPVDVGLDGVFRHIAFGVAAGCVVVGDESSPGAVVCAGRDSVAFIDEDACGRTFRPSCAVGGWPQGARVAQTAVGRNHACALVDGRVWCWGQAPWVDGSRPCTEGNVPRSQAVRVRFPRQ